MAETLPLQPSTLQPISDLDLERTVQDVLRSAGLEKQIKFKIIGIKLPCLMYRPSGVWDFLSPFWLPTHNHQEPGKPFLRVHALPRQKHVT